MRLRYLLTLVLFACAAIPASASAQSDANPLEGLRFYVDRDSPSWEQWQSYRRSGQTRKANLIWKIAREPRALWFGRFTRPDFFQKVRRRIEPARAGGAVPIFTVLRAESTSCGPGYRAGGPAEDRRIRAWYDDLARAIGDDRVVIAFEPDSLGTLGCLARSRRDDRLRVLRYGVDVLSKLPGAILYVEAGASDWVSSWRMARKLRAVGVHKAQGFMLNATHYDWTRNNIRYGLDLSRRLGGKHFIINTAENGRGPVHYKAADGRVINVWCNPGLRGLGPAPTTDTAHPKVDAYLWINRPGFGQSCDGHKIDWFPPRALSYARFATDWEGPPRGTRLGHFKRYPLSAFGIP
jgi:endoglucanase